MQPRATSGLRVPDASTGLGGASDRTVSELSILLRCRLVQLRNAVDQQLREAPWRTLAILALLTLIWAGLYVLLSGILRHVRSWGLVSAVADREIFLHFFLVLSVMLAFSNAVLAFSSLYGRSEAAWLLVMPVRPRPVILLKWLEGMLLSSWSFLLLGVPLMLAVTRQVAVQWYYYPLFLGHFAAFVTIPACVGLLAAWAVAMFLPRRPFAVALLCGALLLVPAAIWLANLSRKAVEADEWLHALLGQVSLARQPLLPSTWTAMGIVAALQQRVETSLFYLGVVLGNAAFLAWLTVNVLGHTWAEAYSRARQGRLRPLVRRGWITAGLSWLLFFYLPQPLRVLALKDLRGFVRDGRQWTQMVIMLGLLAAYVLNLRRLPLDLNRVEMQSLIAFLNLTTVSLILATFTSRFIFPLPSLESQQLWLLELLPVPRAVIPLVKFLFALTVTSLSALGVMAVAVRVLELPHDVAQVHLLVCFGVALGLSGLATGLGARFPLIGQRNPARIAAGFGGTLNLVASMIFVLLEMAGLAVLTLSDLSPGLRLPHWFVRQSEWLVVAMPLLGVLVAGGAMWIGARHFARLEA